MTSDGFFRLKRHSTPKSIIPDDRMPGVYEQFLAGIPYKEIAKQWCCTVQCIKDSIGRYKKSLE